MYIYRHLLPEILSQLKKKDGLAIIGPRRIGKSYLLNELKMSLEKKGKKNLAIQS